MPCKPLVCTITRTSWPLALRASTRAGETRSCSSSVGPLRATTAPTPITPGWAQLLANPFVTQNPNLTYQLVDELGWEPYPFVMVATEQTRSRYEQCLRGLIPVLQGGSVRVAREPERLTANLGTISAKLGAPIDAKIKTKI